MQKCCTHATRLSKNEIACAYLKSIFIYVFIYLYIYLIHIFIHSSFVYLFSSSIPDIKRNCLFSTIIAV
jgi:hypothetical protein